MALPTFAKLGAKLVTPSWLSGKAAVGSDGRPLQLMFPRLFDNDAHRVALPNLPSTRFSVLYSSDHALSPLTGYIGRVDFNDIEGVWMDAGQVHSDSHQRETPHPVFDSVNGNRVLVFVHDVRSTVTYGSQASRVLTTTDLASFSDQGECFPYGHHSGYAQVWWDANASLFKALHIMIGGEFVAAGYSDSPNGTTFAFRQFMPMGQNHVAGHGKMLGSDPFYFTHGGKHYLLTNLQGRPRFTASPVESLGAVEVDTTTWRPIGGYTPLLMPGDVDESDHVLNNHNSIYLIDGTLYMFYGARDASGVAAIHVAKANAGSVQTNPLLYPVRSDGELERIGTLSTIVEWDAVNADLPASVTKITTSGSDTSATQAGIGYQLSGTGVLKQWLSGTDAVAVSDYESLEFEIQGLRTTSTGGGLLCFGFNGHLSKWEFDAVYTMWSQPTFAGGRLALRDTDRYLLSREKTWTIPYNTPDEQAWTRANARTLAMRLSDYGRRVSILIDGQVAYSRDIGSDGMVWTRGMRPFVYYEAGSSLFLTRWTLRGWS